jgi:hypothetical protein
MEGKTFNFRFDDLKLSVSGIEEVIGFNENDERHFVRGMIGEILEECREIANIKAEYRIFNDVIFNKENASVSIENQIFDVKKIVFNQVKKSESAALFLCTAGAEIGKRSRIAMNERDLLKGFIFDVTGSEIVEAAADLMQNELAESAEKEGKKITNRYSPGYCGWNVAEQHMLFRCMNNNFCGIKLTESALMNPEKSVSGIIGIGENVKMNPYTCRICDMKDCIYRRVKEGRRKD